MNEFRVLSPESRDVNQGSSGAARHASRSFGRADDCVRPDTSIADPNCSDLHHMKAAGPDIRFYRRAKGTINTARTVEREPSIPCPAAHWNETSVVCI
jgi:hypothetical protein